MESVDAILREIDELRTTRKIFGILSASLVIGPMLVGGIAFYHYEHEVNTHVSSPIDGFFYSYECLTEVRLTDIIPVSASGRLVAVLLGLSKILFLGCLAAVVVLTVEISVKTEMAPKPIRTKEAWTKKITRFLTTMLDG